MGNISIQGGGANNANLGGSRTLIDLSPAKDLSGAMQSAGMSFGRLVAFTGQAVADTQMRLNETGAAMATALATTQVDVITAQESIYDDSGLLHEARSYTRKLPLVNFIDPVFYEWSAVRLQGEFYASGFSGNSTITANTSTETKTPGGGLFGLLFGSNKTNTQSNSSSVIVGSSVKVESSFGHVRASALLQPKLDIGVPAPRQVVRGPSLNVVAGEIKDIAVDGKLQSRTLAALLELRRADGSAIAGKAISIDTDGAPWSFSTTGAELTDAAGRVAITLRRDFLGKEADIAPKDVVLTARLGLVSNSSSLSF